VLGAVVLALPLLVVGGVAWACAALLGWIF
jgi:hypothetical protein